MPPSSFADLLDQEIFVVPSFTLECGRTLKDAPVAYKTWGKLNETKDNVMIICHAFTGSADVEDWFVIPYRRIGVVLLIQLQVGPSHGTRESV